MKQFGDIDAFIKANYDVHQLEQSLMSYPILKEVLGADFSDKPLLDELIDCHEKLVKISKYLEIYRKSLLKED